jgi:hypothetical protein
MKHYSSNGTLRVTKPVGNVLVLAIIYALLLVLTAEGLIRLAISTRLMDVPGIGTINADLNIKIPIMDHLFREDGGIDCIFLGSSMTNEAVNPQIFTQKYFELSGKKITCFNFGVASLSGEIAGDLGQILIKRYHPALLVYGTSARDYSREMGFRGLNKDGWIQFQLGKWNLVGWLKEYSMVYRCYLSFLSDMNPLNKQYSIDVKRITSAYGHLMVDKNNIGIEGENTINEKALFTRDFVGLKQLISLNNLSTRIIVMEIPVHSIFLPLYVNQKTEDYYTLFFHPVESILQKKNIPFIMSITGDYFKVTDDQWADMKHLNYKGAITFSTWLADQIWGLEESGMIPAIKWSNR